MAHYKLYATFRRNSHIPAISHWVVHRPYPTFKVTDLTFFITEQEGFELERQFQRKSVPFELCWVIKKPGGSFINKTYVVRFFDTTAALLWKLSRQ